MGKVRDGDVDLLVPEPAVLTGGLVGYARVSTRDQLLDRQTRALTDAGCLRVFADKQSGRTADRVELDKCLDYLRAGDTLVVLSLDRLSRSLHDLIAIVAELRRRGIGFKSLHEALDTTTPGGRLVFHVFAALSEFIRELIVEGTREGLDAARARGSHLGRPPAMTQEQIRNARDLLTRPDSTVTSIAKLLGVSRNTIYKYLPELGQGRPALITESGNVETAALAGGSAGRSPVPAVGPIPTARACPTCGHEPQTRAEAAHQRADITVTWLHPDPAAADEIITRHHCRQCQPEPPMIDIACALCGDGPIATGNLATYPDGSLPPPAQDWLIAAGWQVSPKLLCPDHVRRK